MFIGLIEPEASTVSVIVSCVTGLVTYYNNYQTQDMIEYDYTNCIMPAIKSLETEAHAFLCANVKYTGEVEFVCTTCRTLFFRLVELMRAHWATEK